MSVLPGIVCIGGIFFLHWSFLTSVLFYQVNLGSNIANAMWPLLAYQRKKAHNRSEYPLRARIGLKRLGGRAGEDEPASPD